MNAEILAQMDEIFSKCKGNQDWVGTEEAIALRSKLEALIAKKKAIQKEDETYKTDTDCKEDSNEDVKQENE